MMLVLKCDKVYFILNALKADTADFHSIGY